MKVNILGQLAEETEVFSFDYEGNSMKEILSLINLHKKELIDKLFFNEYYYILIHQEILDNVIPLIPEVLLSPLPEKFDLYIVPKIKGEFPVPAILVAWGTAAAAAATGTATGTAAFASLTATVSSTLAAIGNMLISVAIGAIMQLLTPTPTSNITKGSSGKSTASNLFNTSGLTNEQGVPVPLIYSNPYCSGVVISSGISTS